METKQANIGNGLKLSLAVLIPVLFLSLLSQTEIVHIANRTFLVISVLVLSRLLTVIPHSTKSLENGSQLVLIFASILFLGLCIHFDEAIFAWLFLVAFFTLLILISESLSNQPAWLKCFGRVILTASSGAFPVLINQIRLRFSEEEFYSAVFIAILSIFWLLLWICYHAIVRKIPLKIELRQIPSISIPVKLALLVITISTFGLIAYSARAYQKSFFSQTIDETFTGISPDHPFVCESLTTPDQSENITGTSVQERYAQAIASKVHLRTLDYGFLATYYQTDTYFSFFKEHLLKDAESNLYTSPAGSVKWDQWQASQVLYYYLKVRELRPALFDPQELSLLENWINAINLRAQQVGWVDWMYALAFSHKPVGAYLNQDIGAGLYSILNQIPSLDESLYSRNSNFLSQSERGWVKGFRVTDDAISYQPVWITNSYFQSLLSGQTNNNNQNLSFEWIKAQTLPNGDMQTYNFPEKFPISPVTLFGANILEDGSLLWLANLSMDTLADTVNLPVQVGAEQKISTDLLATIPDIGSCLLFGDSGLPEQSGPLAPDKIVFRNGWQEDDLYILLNLRFTGWHRYKASNAISLIYAGSPLVEEQYTQEVIPWLPVGRALVRDKRIPIEQLNTLLIQRTGLDAVLNTLVSLFGPYSQDPPFYANVQEFETSESYDHSLTQIENWHGWIFSRSIHFFTDGPVFIIDDATNTKLQSAKIRWHFSPDYQVNHNRLQMEDGNVDFLLIGQEQGLITPVRKDNELLIEYESPRGGELKLLTIILPGALKDAQFVSYSGNIISLKLDGSIVNYELKP